MILGESMRILFTNGQFLDSCHEDDLQIFVAHMPAIFCLLLMLALFDVSALSMFNTACLIVHSDESHIIDATPTSRLITLLQKRSHLRTRLHVS